MKKIEFIVLVILFSCCFQVLGQKKISIKEIYFENNLAYKTSDNTVFTGQAQQIRKNGHLVFEQFIESGVLTKSVTYFNSIEPPAASSVVYFYEKTETPKKEITYYYGETKVDYEYFDENGEKELEESFENEKLIYQCKFLNGKRHGIEFCITEEGEEMRTEYRNGKKVK